MKRLASLMTIAMGVATAAPPEADRIATFTVNTYLDDADAWSSDIGLNVPVGSAGLRYERGGFSGDLSLGLWGDDEFVATRDLRVGQIRSEGSDSATFGIASLALFY